MKKFMIVFLFINHPINLKSSENTMVHHYYRLITASVTATMYYPVSSQCDADPYITAGMYHINPRKASIYKWIAMSRNLLKRWGGKFDYGDVVYISDAGHKNGKYKVVDTMNKRFRNRIDFLERCGTKHYKFNDVKIKLIKNINED